MSEENTAKHVEEFEEPEMAQPYDRRERRHEGPGFVKRVQRWAKRNKNVLVGGAIGAGLTGIGAWAYKKLTGGAAVEIPAPVSEIANTVSDVVNDVTAE